MSVVNVTEVTELAGLQAVIRTLITAAFTERLPEVTVDVVFHRGWNGGWRARATVSGRAPLDFAMVRTADEELLALPVPFPDGWRRRGVAGSHGQRYRANAAGAIERCEPDAR
ncbi:MAG: hypothetical protein K2R93_16305 [Gemmatimonadaceae bacterium]|nr:hypothetical protein [Gemmatimonadaceae bacterium]